MTNKNTLKKNRVFGISEELDDLLKLYSKRENVSLSHLIRTSLEEKIEKLQRGEQKFWKELSTDRFNEILLSLTDYLDKNLTENDRVICQHNNIWQKNNDDNFKHTKEFCRELQIELQAFLKRVENDEKRDFGCECHLYGILKNRRGSDG